MQYRGRSVPGWPEYEMPEEECGEAAGAGMLGWGPLGWGQRGWRLGFLVRVARGPEGFKLGLSHYTHCKMTGLVRRFSRRRNMSSSRVHCCHNGTEFKGKHILEQDELFCCVIISSGLKEKSICLFLLLESPRPLCPPQGPQTYQPT